MGFIKNPDKDKTGIKLNGIILLKILVYFHFLSFKGYYLPNNYIVPCLKNIFIFFYIIK